VFRFSLVFPFLLAFPSLLMFPFLLAFPFRWYGTDFIVPYGPHGWQTASHPEAKQAFEKNSDKSAIIFS
jgi:hypothetical protein